MYRKGDIKADYFRDTVVKRLDDMERRIQSMEETFNKVKYIGERLEFYRIEKDKFLYLQAKMASVEEHLKLPKDHHLEHIDPYNKPFKEKQNDS